MSDAVTRLNAALEGRYRIERQLGEGGMATVYLARDEKHNRHVALKVLKPELAAVVGAERFLAEIETTANLQHPHILPLFDSGEADSFLFYVMPYVEGESLREKLDREHQLPVDEAVQIATKVAGALQAAHERGVIHRDIKPANILLSKGEPLVGDFGIALAVSAGGAGRLTETGLSVGTPHYMSPEQATGDASVGAATDVYALGCVLYEMLVGEPPYTGSTPQAILGKIIQAEPVSATKARRTVPPHVDAAIRRALEKVPADRFGSAGDLAHALSDSSFAYGPLATSAAPSYRSRNRLAVTFAGTTAALALALAWVLMSPEAPPATERQVLATEGWAGIGVAFGGFSALAPDGSSMILPLDGQLGLKMRGSTELTPIAGTEGARDVQYSPDGRSIVYAVGADLFRQSITGGVPQRIATDAQPTNRLGLAWLENGTILYETVDPFRILQIPETGGESRVALDPANVWWIQGLPGGQAALVVIQGEVGQLVALDLREGATVPLVDDAVRAWYADTGHIVYVRSDGTVFAQPFDPGSLQLAGTPVLLFDNVRYSANRAEMQLSRDGTLMYVEGGTAATGRRLVTVDLEGNVEPLPLEVGGGGGLSVGWLPDGRTIVFHSDGHIYTYDVELGQAPRQITFEGTNQVPVPGPDGSRVLFRSDRAGSAGPDLYVKDLRDDSPPRRILELEGTQTPSQWPADSLVLFEHAGERPGQLMVLDLSDPDGPRARPYLPEEGGNGSRMTISPNGRLAAYRFNDGIVGRRIYLRAFPDPGQPLAVLDASVPVWSPDGSTLYGFSGSNAPVIAARLRTEPVPSVVRVDTLFTPSGTSEAAPASALHPDGQRFILSTTDYLGTAEAAADRLILVEHFFTELCERVGGC